MGEAKKVYINRNFDSTIKEYLKQARNKLENELDGTREAMRLIAIDKTKDFIKAMDKGLDKEERDYFSALIVACMYQSFCYGYGIGMIEGKNNTKVIL
jgi:hypothetical protein